MCTYFSGETARSQSSVALSARDAHRRERWRYQTRSAPHLSAARRRRCDNTQVVDEHARSPLDHCEQDGQQVNIQSYQHLYIYIQLANIHQA